MRLTIEKKIILIVVLFLLSSAGIIVAIIIPSVRSVRELESETVELRTYMEKKYQQTHTIRQTVEEGDQMRSSTRAFPERIYRSTQTLELVTMLEAIATRNNVSQKINSTNLDQITEGRAVISLTINGNYPNVLGYLKDLENAPYFINVTTLALSPLVDRFGGEVTATSPVTLNLDLSLYATP